VAKRSSKQMPGNPSRARPAFTPPKGRPTAARSQAPVLGPRRRRALTYGIGVLSLGVLVVVAVAAFSGSGSRGTGSTEPTRFDLPALHGKTRVRLADFRGKPLVVNFFASWCTACDEELPGFARVSKELKGKVAFVGVNSLETGDRDFMPDRHHITWWPLASDIDGAQGSGLHDALGGGSSMPLTAFYDADGKLLAVQRAAIPEPTLRQAIHQLYGITT